MGTILEGFHRKRKSKETSSKLFGLNPCLRFFEGLKKTTLSKETPVAGELKM